jgi:hypothetical protein
MKKLPSLKTPVRNQAKPRRNGPASRLSRLERTGEECLHIGRVMPGLPAVSARDHNGRGHDRQIAMHSRHIRCTAGTTDTAEHPL